MCGFVSKQDMEGPSVEGSADGEVLPAVVENQPPLDYSVYEVFGSHNHHSRQQTDELNRAFLGGEGVTSDAEPVQTGDVGRLDQQGAGGQQELGGFAFDTNLASLHSYLGDVDDVGSHRFSGAGGACLVLPMFYLEGIVLFPEQKLPLRVLHSRFKAAVERAMRRENNDAPHTLGVIHVRVEGRQIHVAQYGTTAEIRQLRYIEEDNSVNIMTKGRQRFRILKAWQDVDETLFAQVQIMEEDTLMKAPRAAFGLMAPVYKRSSGSAERATPTIQQSHRDGDNELHHESEDEFEQENLRATGNTIEEQNREVHLASEQTAVTSLDVGEEEDEGPNEEGELGSESEDIARVLDEEGDDEGEYQDEQDEAPEWLFERPTVRQSLGDGAAIGRRLEERRRVRRLPSEGRNREEQPGEAAAVVSGPADRGLIPRDGVWVNAYAKWREDAARNSLKAQLAFWPHWVYRQFDAYDLARRAADMLRQMGDHPRMESLVRSPVSLAYYIASNIPLQDHTRQELLEMGSTVDRLRREIQLLDGMDKLRCNRCQEVIARRSDMLVMSSDGAIGAYVNAHGYVHETLTLSSARGMRVAGHPQTENSWFPGYAWVLAKCETCHRRGIEQHMGWRFTAVDKETRPRSFWGIRRTQLIGKAESLPQQT